MFGGLSHRRNAAMTEQRKEARQGTLMPGKIAYERGSQVRDCAVCDISKEGARLTFANPRGLPKEFELLIATTGDIYQAVVKWRRGREIGVYFVEKDDVVLWPARRQMAPVPPPPAS
jgi:hypothetical protein